jgi:short subunit dehydrogenase-like uncharacterized protein
VVSEKDLDVVVFGATGVTGRRVAAYLASRGVDRWAAAARDHGRIESVLAEQGVSAPELIDADLGREESLVAMARRARVVLNLVGPYACFGRPVVRACVEGGAHYADLSGEMPFVRRVIDEFDAAAAAAGIKLVQPCGFESLPPDLAVRLAAEALRERWGEPLDAVELEAMMKPPPGLPRPSDGISGGTFASMIAAIEDDMPEVVLDPAALIEDPERAEAVRRRSPISVAPRRGADGSVLTPMLPAAYINPAVIQRSALLAEPGTPPPRYREAVALPGAAASLPLRWAAAGLLSALQAGLGAGLRASPATRRRIARVMRRVLPPSGYGPRSDRLEGWTWTMSVTGQTAGGREVNVNVAGSGHIGYLATARMLGEAGLLLAEEGATPERAGCLTPSLALGTATLGRFERAGLRVTLSAVGE